MTGDESLQFVEYLRHNRHLTETGGDGVSAQQVRGGGGPLFRSRSGHAPGYAVRATLGRGIFAAVSAGNDAVSISIRRRRRRAGGRRSDRYGGPARRRKRC